MSRSTLALRVRDAIKAYIVSENLEPGSRIPSERQLSEALAVSRNVVREGLSALVAEGIIVKKPGRGIFLCEFDHEVLTQEGTRVLAEEQARYDAVREARAVVEVGAVGLIVNNITEEELQCLEELTCALERKLERGESFAKEDMQFHLTLLRAARNELLLQWSPLVEEVMRTWAYHTDALALAFKSPPAGGEGGRVAAEHRAILEAVRQRNVEEARGLLRQHFLIPGL
jgi:GntR family transcriptional repressor for pyruvate dehydrogenase complex